MESQRITWRRSTTTTYESKRENPPVFFRLKLFTGDFWSKMKLLLHSRWSESFIWLTFLQRQWLDLWKISYFVQWWVLVLFIHWLNKVFWLFSLLLWLMSIHPWHHISRKVKPPFCQCSAHWLVKNHNRSRGTLELSASSMWPGGLLLVVGVAHSLM